MFTYARKYYQESKFSVAPRFGVKSKVVGAICRRSVQNRKLCAICFTSNKLDEQLEQTAV